MEPKGKVEGGGSRGQDPAELRPEAGSPESAGMALADVEVHAAIKSFLEHAEIRLEDVEIHAAVSEGGPAGQKKRSGSSVVILTANENLDYLFRAFQEGALDQALKHASGKELDAVVRQVLRGESPLDPDVAATLLQKLGERSKEQTKPPPESLTPRQLDVLKLLARGKSNKEIARELVLSTGTVRIHVQNIIAKLGVSDRTGAVVRAIELGLITPESNA